MKSWSVKAFLAIISVVVCGIVINFSCSKDSCKDAHCLNGATCSGGGCYCATGFEGLKCENAWRQKFTGNWTQNASNGTQFIVVVNQGTGPTDVVMLNFNNTFSQIVTAYAATSDSLVIPTQGLPGGVVAGYAVYGVSVTDPLSYGNIKVHYTISDANTGAVLTTVDTRW